MYSSWRYVLILIRARVAKKDLGSKATPKLIRLLTNRKKVIGNYFNLLNFISKANGGCNCAMFAYKMRTLSQ